MQGDFKVPFTCGSQARRAVIKYFVRDFAVPANGPSGFCATSQEVNKTTQDANKQRLLNAVHKQLDTLHTTWKNYYNFFCQNPDTKEQGLQYCNAENSETWTPTLLRGWDHISGSDVAEEIFDSLGCFYNYAMADASIWTKYLQPSEKERYRWSQSTSNAYAARESSLFHTSKPVVEYSEKTELNEPLTHGVSMKEMCAGLLGQVYFTLPLTRNAGGQWVPTTLKSMDAYYSPYTASSTPNITALEDFMLKVSREAFYSSPYYRHYAMRHLASNSTACPSFAATVQQEQAAPQKSYTVQPFGTSSGWMPSLHLQNFSIPHKGFMSNLLGSASTATCFCGFAKAQIDNRTSMCQLPANIVRDIQVFADTLLPPTPDFFYLRDKIIRDQQGQFSLKTENHRVQRTLSKIWLAGMWECPELTQISDHWGIVRDANAWISNKSNYTLDAGDFFERGYGGLRIGTMEHVQREVQRKLNPSLRVGMQNPSDGGPITGHTRCAMDEPSMRPESLADKFVDDLFPAAQGVFGSAPVSHCLRFVIELARLQAMTLADLVVKGDNGDNGANGANGAPNNASSSSTFAQQSFIANSWKSKCAAQIDLVGMCAVTRALDAVGGVWSTGEPDCPFEWSGGNGKAINGNGYITPSCLVYIHTTSEVHDPCRYYDCSAESVKSTKILITPSTLRTNQAVRTKTLLPYNPLQFVNVAKDVFAGAKWSTDALESSKNASQHASFLSRMGAWYSNLQKAIPPRLSGISRLYTMMTQESENENKGDENECSMMVDWWPQQFEYPSGYHPTLPCMNRDAAHRTYDQVFAASMVDETMGEDSDIEMMYMPLDMRDGKYVHSHFGMEGICRATNYDLDMAEVNTARVCTRQRVSPTHDPSVPKSQYQRQQELNKAWGPAYCAESSTDVPWSVEDWQTNMGIGMMGPGIFSVGSVPLFARRTTNISRSATFPDASLRKKLRLWQLQNLLNNNGEEENNVFGSMCTHANLPDPCTDDQHCASGFQCHAIAKICVKVDPGKCYVHQDCAQDQYMCSGKFSTPTLYSVLY
jgi:hypothetical protein